MHMKYAPRSPDDIVTLIGDHPLCWIVSHSEAGFGATPLPLLAECDADGALVSLLEAHQPPNTAVWALYPQQRHLSPKVRQLIDWLRLGLSQCREYSEPA